MVLSTHLAIYDRKRNPEYLGCLPKRKVDAFIDDYLYENATVNRADIYTQPATQKQMQQEILDNAKIQQLFPKE